MGPSPGRPLGVIYFFNLRSLAPPIAPPRAHSSPVSRREFPAGFEKISTRCPFWRVFFEVHFCNLHSVTGVKCFFLSIFIKKRGAPLTFALSCFEMCSHELQVLDVS